MRSNLLDTHALIWFLEGDNSLSNKAKKMIDSKGVINFVSIASLWEMSIKISLNKLEINAPLEKVFELIKENGFIILPIAQKDILSISTLPFHHRDPFDRIIISQAINNKLVLLSKDRSFKNYDVNLVW